jgi:hypothetical protein
MTKYIGPEYYLKQGIGIRTLYPEGDSITNVGKFITTVLPNALIIAGLVGFFFLLIAGIAYIVEAGKGNADGVAKVLKWINSTLIGLIIVFISYWLVRIVQLISGVEILSP